jgi:hypothetical protein
MRDLTDASGLLSLSASQIDPEFSGDGFHLAALELLNEVFLL